MSKKNRACYGCERRVVGCHSWCGDYFADCEELADKNKKIKDGKAQEALVRDYRIKMIKKVQRKKEQAV